MFHLQHEGKSNVDFYARFQDVKLIKKVFTCLAYPEICHQGALQNW